MTEMETSMLVDSKVEAVRGIATRVYPQVAKILRRMKKLGLKGSPSLVMNNGRQVLYGNVGYRIINANVKELLKRPDSEASWC